MGRDVLANTNENNLYLFYPKLRRLGRRRRRKRRRVNKMRRLPSSLSGPFSLKLKSWCFWSPFKINRYKAAREWGFFLVEFPFFHARLIRGNNRGPWFEALRTVASSHRPDAESVRLNTLPPSPFPSCAAINCPGVKRSWQETFPRGSSLRGWERDGNGNVLRVSSVTFA